MKIKTAKDVEKLDAKIKSDLGIDVSKYRNEEVAENFAKLLVFPVYIRNWVLRPLVISIIIYLIGFLIFNLTFIEYFIYGLLGFILFFGVGVLLGLLLLSWKMKADMWSIIDYSLDIMKSAIVDLDSVNSQMNVGNRKDVLGLLFKGIIHIVTIPMISKVVGEKVPIVGRFVSKGIKRVLTIVANIVKFDELQLKDDLKEDEKESKIIENYSLFMTNFSDILERVMDTTFNIARLPLLLTFIGSLVLLIVFLYLVG